MRTNCENSPFLKKIFPGSNRVAHGHDQYGAVLGPLKQAPNDVVNDLYMPNFGTLKHHSSANPQVRRSSSFTAVLPSQTRHQQKEDARRLSRRYACVACTEC
ncbi:hypothetical protein V6Z11_D09G104800 [Gossypium hirsutum]